ncbi:MAG TPA: hypothetical protein VN819_05105 [Thermoplasmata archaeon]|nr:hypothetical protein [Thermoplasmata archaeon]
METKPKDRASSALKFTGGEDEKMQKIVDEVDRFFQSVHADIEDWKFSMEDYGDGPRIFVRFQIHINKPGSSSGRKISEDKPPALTDVNEPKVAVAIPDAQSPPEPSVSPKEGHEPEGTRAALREDPDLASFVELWRRKRASNQGAEFHKVGAPYVDGVSEWKGTKRSGDPAPRDVPSERTDEERKVPDSNS